MPFQGPGQGFGEVEVMARIPSEADGANGHADLDATVRLKVSFGVCGCGVGCSEGLMVYGIWRP